MNEFEFMIAAPGLIFLASAIWLVSTRFKSKLILATCIFSGVACLAASAFTAFWFAM